MLIVELQGVERVQRLLVALSSFASSRQILLRQLGGLIRQQHQRRVLSEKTSPDGAAWAALKPSTIARKGNSNILVETGRMANAWLQLYGADFVRMRNGQFYLKFHQFGTRKMVARPVMGFSAQNLDEIGQVVSAFVSRRLGVAA